MRRRAGRRSARATTAPTTTAAATTTTEAPKPVWPLTGLPLDDSAAAQKPAIVVKVGNYDRHPQRGTLDAAMIRELRQAGAVGEVCGRFIDALQLVTRLVNIGDAKSLACHPASTTHRQLSPQEQLKAGVKPELIRLSIGIEHVDDILADVSQALAAAAA